jgi:hypothetical protein
MMRREGFFPVGQPDAWRQAMPCLRAFRFVRGALQSRQVPGETFDAIHQKV